LIFAPRCSLLASGSSLLAASFWLLATGELLDAVGYEVPGSSSVCPTNARGRIL